ncbi:MAG: C10 family peptidase [Prevotella sp.]|nr:C10 family peptidase [Prevotella sp.]
MGSRKKSFNKGTAYNFKCPKVTNTSNNTTYYCLTGCVATAMAQAMKFNEWPQEACTEIPSYTSGQKYTNVTAAGTLAALPPTTFDWVNMKGSYTGSEAETDAEAEAVSTLMRYCGQSVEMKYCYDSSGAVASNVATALKNYFGYDDAVRYVDRSSYTLDGWIALVYGELSEGRVVILEGQSSNGGHAFVCDGYDTDNYFHINWGWGGYQDGFYLLSLCNPNDNNGSGSSGTKDGYSSDQGAIIGIQRPDGETFGGNVHMTAQNLSVSGTVVTTGIYNLTSGTYTFDLGFGLKTDDGYQVLDKYQDEFEPYYGDSSLDIDLSGKGLEDGTYELHIISKLSSSDTWVNSSSQFVVVTVSGGVVTLTLPVPELSLESVSLSTDGYAGDLQEVVAKLKNSSAAEYYDNLYFFASTTSDMGSAQSCTGSTVPANGKSLIPFYFTPTSAGTYNVWVATDEAGTDVVGTATVEILDKESSASYIVQSITASNSEVKSGVNYIYGPASTFTITVQNNDSNLPLIGDIDVSLYKQESSGSTSYSGYSVGAISVNIPAGETKSYDFTLSDLQVDNTLKYMFYVGGYQFVFWDASGVTTYLGDGSVVSYAASESFDVASDAVVVDLRGVSSVTSITPNSNPNTLYLLDENADTPDGISGLNVVKGTAAESIVLQDGYDFYSPIDFTAESVSYTRTPQLAYNGEATAVGWETMVLPFAATKAVRVSDNKNLTWFTSATESGKNMWIKEFSGVEDGTTLYYNYPTQLKANTPYIIAVPGNKWGKAWKLQGEAITFSAENAVVKATVGLSLGTNSYTFTGALAATDVETPYQLDAAGSKFMQASGTVTVNPFRAYVTLKMALFRPEALAIATLPSTTTGIVSLEMPEPVASAEPVIYNLQGQRVGIPAKGVYIKNGKKYLTK